MTVVVSQAVEGYVMSLTKRYRHWGFASPAFLAIGGGLLYTVDISTTSARLIGIQILYGLGVGLTQNVAFLSVQADNEPKTVTAAIAIVSFAQLFGGMCGPVIGNAVLSAPSENISPFSMCRPIQPRRSKVLSPLFGNCKGTCERLLSKPTSGLLTMSTLLSYLGLS
jgi:hypothetical protein